MKKWYKTMAILLFVSIATQQIIAQTALFRKNFYKTDGYMTYRKGLETADGGYMMLGDLADATSEDIVITRLDRNGVLQWSKRYATDSAAYASDIVEMPNGNYLICGERYHTGTIDMITFRINPQGNLVGAMGTFFTGTGTANDDDLTYAAVRIGNGANSRYAVCGISYSEDVSSQALSGAVVVFIDSSGTIDDYKTVYGRVGGSFNGIISADRMPDGGAICAGHSAVGASFDPMFIRLNADGSTRWVRRMFGMVGAQLTTQVKALPSGGFIAASSGTNAAANQDNTWVARFDANGAMMWFKLLQSNNFHRPYALSIVSDSTVLVYGHYNADPASTTGSKFRPFFSKMSLSDGAIRWTKSYGGDSTFAERANHLISMNGGAITTISEKIVTIPGDTLLGTQVLKTDFLGNLPNCINKTFAPTAGGLLTFQDSTRFLEGSAGRFGTITVRASALTLDVQNLCTATNNTQEVVAESHALRVYPNPSKNGQSFVVDVDKWDGDAVVELLDMTGKIIFRQQLTTQTTTLTPPPSIKRRLHRESAKQQSNFD